MAGNIACKMALGLTWILLLVAISIGSEESRADECHIIPVIHVLQHPGCVPKPIPSFACQGRCTSYVQVSGYKLWQTERSCMCCQEMGVREASVNLFCPKSKSGDRTFRKITTKSPMECMCRPCNSVDDNVIKPQEVAALMRDISVEDVKF